MTDTRISRQVPLDQLRQPDQDVRERRTEDDVMSLAASMGDPDVGQLQDALVYPAGYEDVVNGGTAEELDELFRDDHPLVVYDGETRRQAARKLGWATLSCTIVPERPEAGIVGQLDANTERVPMTEFETARALYEWYQETDATLEDVGNKTGYSSSYVSRIFSLLESPDIIREAWRNPDHPLDTTRAIDLNQMLSSDALQRYQEAGGLDDEAAHERAFEDVKTMLHTIEQYDPAVGDFRNRIANCVRETLDQLKDQRTLDEKAADGQTKAAEQEVRAHHHEEEDPTPCIVCGHPADRKFAADVCQQDYGMLSEKKAAREPLLKGAGAETADPDPPEDLDGNPQEAAQALAAAAGISPEDAAHVVSQVQQQAAQAPQEGQHD